MGGYKPLKITGNSTGLVQSREEFILPDDAYPTLENAFVWRERIKRKQGVQLLGRLKRVIVQTPSPSLPFGNINLTNPSPNVVNIFTQMGGILATQPNASIVPGSSSLPIQINIGGQSLQESTGEGVFTIFGAGVITAATINYGTGDITISFSAPAGPLAVLIFQLLYYPSLPVMGLRSEELNDTNNERCIAFDQRYAYRFGANGWEEFLPGATGVWTGTDSDFFWSTNYWVDSANRKIFWVTNDTTDGIRYTNGVPASLWVQFAPKINASNDTLTQCLCMLPFRGRMVVFNTVEKNVSYPNRIRWAAIGNPFSDVSAIVTSVNANAWKDDIRGQGGFLDIPTSENIITVGFVRDNLVIFCERSTWQLRYTGRSIAPFQIEKVNSELGVESTFSQVQFDTSLVGVGDKGIVECDSFKSDRIDIKIPDLVFRFSNDLFGTKRVHGIRDFVQKLAYWIYHDNSNNDDNIAPGFFPDRRLVYNYENDSWAIFTDCLTCLGTFQPQTSRRWIDFPGPRKPQNSWAAQNYSWADRPAQIPEIIGGNQQGFVFYLDQIATNDVSLYVTNIVGFGVTPADPPASVTSPAHNLQTGQIIQISNLAPTSPAYVLNDGIFSIVRVDSNTFTLLTYNSTDQQFSSPGQAQTGTFFGDGQITVRDNFRIVSKKFNNMDQGQKLQLGYVDVLMDTTESGAISMNVYVDYNDSEPSNTFLNDDSDTFFNSIVPTSISALGIPECSKTWQRVFCPTVGNFITIEWTFSPGQMAGVEQTNNVQIDAQVIWARAAGRMTI